MLYKHPVLNKSTKIITLKDDTGATRIIFNKKKTIF